MTTGIFIQYDTTTFPFTPVVNYSRQPIDFGYVYGYNTDISLDGFYTGITTTGAAISFITGIFGNQFKALTVTDDKSNVLYQWSGVTVDSITFDTNHYFTGAFLKYSIKLRAYDFPSGVIEPSNEYGFAQNEDGTVTVNHKISARGVRNSAGAFDNAVAFVKQFTGKDPFANCAPFFVPSGSGVMLSLSESINRADAIYSVTEVYKYNTGAFVPYVRTDSLEINDSMDAEYRIIDYTLKLQGSPVNNNLSSVIGNMGYTMLTDIQNNYGFSTSGWIKNTYAANIDSGAASIDVKANYLSGAYSGGFLDYSVLFDYDRLTNTENWKLDGEFKCFGPIEFRQAQLRNFKATNNIGQNGWRQYASGLIVNSPLYANQHNTSKMMSPNMKLSVDENTQLATLKISADLMDGYEPVGLSELKCNWEVNPSRWIYELLPSATIEGAYVVQDLQTMTQTQQKFDFTAKSANVPSGTSLISGYMGTFVSGFVITGNPSSVTAFLKEDELATGTFDISASQLWIGADSGVSSGILALQSAGSLSGYVPFRQAGYNFGY